MSNEPVPTPPPPTGGSHSIVNHEAERDRTLKKVQKQIDELIQSNQSNQSLLAQLNDTVQKHTRPSNTPSEPVQENFLVRLGKELGLLDKNFK